MTQLGIIERLEDLIDAFERRAMGMQLPYEQEKLRLEEAKIAMRDLRAIPTPSQRAGSDTEGAHKKVILELVTAARACAGFPTRLVKKEYRGSPTQRLADAIEAYDSLPTTPATSDEGEKPPQRGLEEGKTSESLPRPGLPQGQRAELICECPPPHEPVFGGFRLEGNRVICNTCHRECGSGKRPTSKEVKS